MKFILALLVLVVVSASYGSDPLPPPPFHTGIPVLPPPGINKGNPALTPPVIYTEKNRGNPATKIIPYLVAIYENRRQRCGGAIISERLILTAAHCTYRRTPDMLMIQYGVTDLGIPGGVTVPVQEIITHEEYIDDGRYNYDIALLKLKEDIVFGGTAQPIKLPKCKGCTTATSGFVAGWGQQYDNQNPNDRRRGYLQTIKLNIIKKETCLKMIPDLKPRTLCTLNGKGQGVCFGDSGGPLEADGVVIGIVSSGKSCAGGLPDMFTKVDEYLDWIKKYTP